MVVALSRFMADVQNELQKLGASAALSIDEQDLVMDYDNQQFSAAKCAAQISRERAER